MDNENLTIYELKSKKVYNHIPLEQIVRLESELYRHHLILDHQLPALKILYQQKITPNMNQLEEVIIKTTRKEWILPRLLRSSIRTKTLGLFYQSLEIAKVNFDQECGSLIKAYSINHKSIVADTCANIVESLILHTCIDQSAKFKLFSTCLIDILVNEIDQTFKWLKKNAFVEPPSDVPKFIILKNGEKEIAKLLPCIPSPTHQKTISNSLYFASLCLDWITSGVYNHDIKTINIPRLEFNTNQSEISSLDLVNDISDQLKLYDVDNLLFNSLCTSLCSLASEIAFSCIDMIRFTQPDFLARNCIYHITFLARNSYQISTKDLLHAYRHCQLLNYLLKTFQISKRDLKNIPDYKYMSNIGYFTPESSKERIRLITITNEILFQITQ